MSLISAKNSSRGIGVNSKRVAELASTLGRHHKGKPCEGQLFPSGLLLGGFQRCCRPLRGSFYFVRLDQNYPLQVCGEAYLLVRSRPRQVDNTD